MSNALSKLTNTFILDFDSVASTYLRTLTIRNVTKHKTIVINFKPPPDWDNMVFKQLNRNAYYYACPNLLAWDGGEVSQENCIQELLARVNLCDTLLVNNLTKQAMLEHFGFKHVIVV